MKRAVASLLLISTYIAWIAPVGSAVRAQGTASTLSERMKNTPGGLTFRLSEGSENAETRTVQPPASTEPISGREAEKLLGRLPEIKSDPSDTEEFKKRLGTLPAPKAGNKVPVKFPADDQISPPVSGQEKQPLQVLRYSPEGEVTLAPDLSITFSQPMVAVTSQEEAAQYAPVEMTPQVEGRWRWLGTRTLMFDTDKRFPMATRFTVRIPAGTRSATGQTIAKDVSWTFTTPPPKVEQMIPQGQTVRRNALMYLRFDQAIDPAAVLRMLNVTGGGKKLQVRLATEAEVSGDASISYAVSQSQPGRSMVFRAVEADGGTENALPGASPISVTVGKGTPSAEGPITTPADQSFGFNTYGAFKFQKAYCNWEGSKTCSPADAWWIQFTNTIDSSAFRKDMVSIEPAVEGLTIYPSGNVLQIYGYKKGNTTYKVTVDASLGDVFGQKLGGPAAATFKVGSAPQTFFAQGGAMTVLDPAAPASFSIYSTNHSSARLKVYRVTPSDWYQFTQYYQRLNYDDNQRPAIPGKLLEDKLISIKNVADEIVETRIDLKPYLDGDLGNVIVDITPTVQRDKYDRSRAFTWIQRTAIGLDAFVDNSELVGFATELSTGKPMSGVELSIYPNGSSATAQTETPAVEKGWFGSAWEWLTGTGGPSAGDIESFGPQGETIESESVEPAQGNVTGANGILRLPLPSTAWDKGMNVLIAKKGNDTAFLPENSDYFWQGSGSWYKRTDTDSLRWFVFDDRKIYKPNEEVSVKGYIRQVTAGKLGDIAGLGDAASGITWSVKDPRNNEIAKGTGSLDAFGSFDLKFKLPDNANLGYARVELSTNTALSGGSYAHQFQIQEFRRPEFEVKASVDSEGPHFVGDEAQLSVQASYYAGGGLANAETNWTVTATPTTYTPPNRDDYTFGTWVPWWRGYDYGRSYGGGTTQYLKGVTDAAGVHHLKINFDSVNPPRPYAITASASVQDVNRQTWAGQTSLLVHPADLYVGIKTPRTFVQKGENIRVDSIVTDLDGKLIDGRNVEVKAVLKDWQFDKGSWAEVTVDEQTCNVTSSQQPGNCVFTAKAGGRYTITATVMDDRERFNQSEMTVWVPGGKQPPKRNVEQEEVQIIPSKKDYASGDVAELLVIAPFTPAEGVLTLRRDGIVKTERFTMKDSSVTLKVPIDEKYLPNIYAQVDLVGSAERQVEGSADKSVRAPLAKRPAFATGNLNLPISTDSRKLFVSAEPKDKTLVPGGETKVDIEVKDNHGEPVADSEVAVVIVDEAVLALSRYSIADPMGVFYLSRGTGTTDYHLRKDVLLGNPADAKVSQTVTDAVTQEFRAAMPMMARGRDKNLAAPAPKSESKISFGIYDIAERDENAPEQPIELRSNFDALAVFAPSIKTDSNGRATVDVKLPDNLTRYRITAVSVDRGNRFGKSESNLTAKRPLMVRPSAPRFMNFGDKIELPVVVQNQTDKDLAVDVAVRASNAQLLDGIPLVASDAGNNGPVEGNNSSGKRVLVKANGREEVRFPVSTVSAGTARFQIAVTSGSYSDAAEISLPVWTPATTEAFATYGTTDQNGAIFQPVQTPGGVFPQFGGLEVTTSSTQLQELTDAFLYLTNYPYACSEQISSRMISIAAMRDVLSAFKAKDMPSPETLNKYFARDIEILQSRQRNDGSFGLWRRDKERYEYPFLTVHAAHALALAKAKGYKVPDEMLNKTKPYLKDVEKHFDEWYKNSPQVRWTISAYALYVRDLMGDKDPAKATKLLAEMTGGATKGGNPRGSEGALPDKDLEKAPFEALGWILSVLADDPGSTAEVDTIIRYLMNHTTETAVAANFVTDYGDGAWLIMYSNRRADGVLLEALLKAQPNNDFVPKLVRGLLDHRVKGAWSNTQENVFILLALDKYFNTYEKVTPDFVSRIWLGNTYAGEQAFKGRSADSNELLIPMSYLVDQGGKSNLIIDKQGAGRIYYRIGMKYAPKNLKLDPADYGFTVIRKYEAVDDKDDVKQNPDGSWTIKSGARVRVRLTMVAQARRYHVALVDNLPAGLEILNPGLATTEAIPPDTGTGNTGVVEVGSRAYGRNYYWWRMNWFEHQNFRDERAEAFTSLLWEGVYNYTYVTRATTPGRFVVPPAKAEEMYHPETFGRTGTDLVTVE